MFLGPLLLILLIIGIIFVFIPTGFSSRSNNSYISHHANSSRALDIIKERYAKGEITEEEYLRIKRNLE